jgi:hypothetical protein
MATTKVRKYIGSTIFELIELEDGVTAMWGGVPWNVTCSELIVVKVKKKSRDVQALYELHPQDGSKGSIKMISDAYLALEEFRHGKQTWPGRP